MTKRWAFSPIFKACGPSSFCAEYKVTNHSLELEGARVHFRRGGQEKMMIDRRTLLLASHGSAVCRSRFCNGLGAAAISQNLRLRPGQARHLCARWRQRSAGRLLRPWRGLGVRQTQHRSAPSRPSCSPMASASSPSTTACCPEADVATQASDVEKAYAYVRANIAGHGGDPTAHRRHGPFGRLPPDCIDRHARRAAWRTQALILDDTRAYDLDGALQEWRHGPGLCAGLFRSRAMGCPCLRPPMSMASQHPPTFIAYSRASGYNGNWITIAGAPCAPPVPKVTLFDGSAYTHMSIGRDFGEDSHALTTAVLDVPEIDGRLNLAEICTLDMKTGSRSKMAAGYCRAGVRRCNCSLCLFHRNSRRKTASHFSWNCS